MKFPGFSRYMTGIAVPVSALRSKQSFGIGEFADLVPLGTWCVKTGLDIIQILPVNDTGSQPSPYSALSACALHPVYLRLDTLPELQIKTSSIQALKNEIKTRRKELETPERVDFPLIRSVKIELLRRIYAEAAGEIQKDSLLEKWIGKNPWVLSYALFCVLKERNGGASWIHWAASKEVSPKDIEKAWRDKEEKKELLFHAWIQKRLEEQFRDAAEKLDSMGILLKGDLPIMMSEDSADVWAHPDLFIRDLRAGAPPDMFSPAGQNWDFPIYDWEAQRKTGYSWWKERLRRADFFYHAYRIDHVLGFFRIWAIPAQEKAGVLGYFKPSRYMTEEELVAAGFGEGRIRWMCRPHVSGEGLRNIFGDAAEEIQRKFFEKLGTENLFLFQRDVSESLIEGLGLPAEQTQALLGFYRDRTLIETEPGKFAPAWCRNGSQAYKSLDDGERNIIGGLISRYFSESETAWSRDGEALLSFMKGTSSMLPCAEDLGVVPDSVPVVLQRLGILGLKIPRWVRRYHEPGEPFISPGSYPHLTVCAASVHDTTTLREWWETEAEKNGFWRALGFEGEAPHDYGPETAAKIFEGLLAAESVLVMFQAQDFFALDEGFRARLAADERINVPGLIRDTNWSYRIPFTLEELEAGAALKKRIRALTEKRRAKKPPETV